MGFYLEVYNLGSVDGATEAELVTSLEQLDSDGNVESAFSLSGQAQTLKHPGVNQWNLVRSFSLGGMRPGAYRLLVEVRDKTDDELVQRALDFRIVDTEELVGLYNWRNLERPER